jgi:hypothetical protein
MKAYHEKESPSLSQSSIRCFKNIVEEPKIMARPHWHNSYEILYVKRGCGEQYINSKKFSFVINAQGRDLYCSSTTVFENLRISEFSVRIAVVGVSLTFIYVPSTIIEPATSPHVGAVLIGTSTGITKLNILSQSIYPVQTGVQESNFR